MKNSYLPLINSDRIIYHNFYSVCIRAIELNKEDKILNKSEIIKNIEKLRDNPSMRKGKNFLSKTYLNDKKPSRKILNLKYRKIPNRKRTLVNILSDCKKLESKPSVPNIPPINLGTQENIQIKKIDINNKKEEKTNITNNNIKTAKKMSISNKEEKKPNRSSIIPKFGSGIILKELKKAMNYSKRYLILKKVLQYLESNDITLFEFIKRNPFQSRPYQISKSFEFINAVKFKNYEFVYEALQHSNDYLFCFDYFGQTCYHWAAKLSDLKMLTILIDYGKYHNQKDFKGRTPLYLAAVNNDKAVCEMLLRNKANVHLSDINGNTPADIAGSKELRYYLGDFITQPYSNINCKKRVADYLRVRDEKIKEKKLKEHMKRLEEEKKMKKEQGNEEEEEENNDDNDDEE